MYVSIYIERERESKREREEGGAPVGGEGSKGETKMLHSNTGGKKWKVRNRKGCTRKAEANSYTSLPLIKNLGFLNWGQKHVAAATQRESFRRPHPFFFSGHLN